MKKQWLLCAFALIQLNVLAQTEKGGKLIGVSLGTFNFTNQTEDYFRNSHSGPQYTTNAFSCAVTPSIAWLVKDNVAIGPYITCNYSYSKLKYKGGSLKSRTFNILLGPQLRGYFSSTQKGKVFMDLVLGVGYLSGRQKEEDGGYYYNDQLKITSDANFSASFAFGFEHFITENIGFYGALGIGYTAMNINYDDGHSGSDYDRNKVRTFNFPLQFGFQVHLGGKAKEAK